MEYIKMITKKLSKSVDILITLKYNISERSENIAEREEAMFVESARKQLCIPDGFAYKYNINEPSYWEGAGFWTVYILFESPYTNEVIAGASFDIYEGEVARSILNFMPENY
ncbi:MAG: hypothetical protein IJD91_08720 [Clostridia bacterium]|nr:hypothetical protein [Clostridia bacterium]